MISISVPAVSSGGEEAEAFSIPSPLSRLLTSGRVIIRDQKQVSRLFILRCLSSVRQTREYGEMREADQGSELRREKKEGGGKHGLSLSLVVDGARGEMTSEGVMTVAVPGEEETDQMARRFESGEITVEYSTLIGGSINILARNDCEIYGLDTS